MVGAEQFSLRNGGPQLTGGPPLFSEWWSQVADQTSDARCGQVFA
jgi:hypothetical protein